MKNILIKTNYLAAEKDFIANQFIIGNGRLGYRGTLEEDRANDRVTFNLGGVYDQYEDKWRESLNVFNPLYLRINGDYSAFNSEEHTLRLELSSGLFMRETKFGPFTISSERFLHKEKNIIASKIRIMSHQDATLYIQSGLDPEVYEINGPHYQNVDIKYHGQSVTAVGRTNENKFVKVALHEVCDALHFKRIRSREAGFWDYEINLTAGMIVTFTKIATVSVDDEQSIKPEKLSYEILKEQHIALFHKRFLESSLTIKTVRSELEFYINYSIYHLLILENIHSTASIPARGLSGQVYKGAIFWDTEIFMLPFYLTTNQAFAKKLILYRIKTLAGAKNKALRFGYKGAFYAWESQEDGLERCSLYNVSDAVTGEPIRTYFADKQIHISADVLFGLNNYIDATNDYDIFVEGALEVFLEVYRFYKSYATFQKGKYHFLDVVGPDEYHERVDDNAFTNYQIKYSLENILLKIFMAPDILETLSVQEDVNEIQKFINLIYLPTPDKNGIIEQFSGYFSLEDIPVPVLKERIRNPQAYLGGKDGLATPTRVIKQADVICLLALYPTLFSDEVVRNNFEFYEKYTEHGSSLSNAMYGLVCARLGYEEQALTFLERSAKIDLTTSYKLWAGGIYIGGTHPASSGGAYLIIKDGFLNLTYRNGQATIAPNLPKLIEEITITYEEKAKRETRTIKHD